METKKLNELNINRAYFRVDLENRHHYIYIVSTSDLLRIRFQYNHNNKHIAYG